VKVWRLARLRYAPTPAAAYSGEGAALRGARWNSRGVRIAYASACESLALLEYLVHVELALAPRDLAFFAAEIPSDAVAELEALPPLWNDLPPPRAAAAIGDAFVAGRENLALRVPSIVIPFASNYLIDPAHPRFTEVMFDEPIAFKIDKRLMRSERR
jgi:RES domain-containing protein